MIPRSRSAPSFSFPSVVSAAVCRRADRSSAACASFPTEVSISCPICPELRSIRSDRLAILSPAAESCALASDRARPTSSENREERSVTICPTPSDPALPTFSSSGAMAALIELEMESGISFWRDRPSSATRVVPTSMKLSFCPRAIVSCSIATSSRLTKRSRSSRAAHSVWIRFSTFPVRVRSKTVNKIDANSPVRDMMNLAEAAPRSPSREARISSGEASLIPVICRRAAIRPRKVKNRPTVTNRPGTYREKAGP